jgi:molybdopterin molybdotransferase
MISVQDALRLIKDHISVLQPQLCPVEQAVGLVLAEDVHASIDMPSFRQSAMDGYAFNHNGWQLHGKLTIQGTIQAGKANATLEDHGRAVRIFTGAVVPHNADTVVMQEKVIVEGDRLTITDDEIKQGSNVREKGSQIQKGQLALEKNTKLSPAAIGYLISIGVTHVSVYPRPKISVIATGNELQQIGLPLELGMVYESNSHTIAAALKFLHMEASFYHVLDDLNVVKEKMSDALQDSDIVLMIGGVSVGDFDFVPKAAMLNDVHTIFHKIKQRPGKPIFFGMKNQTPIFGLPGNPSSVLSCFYLYVLPALGNMSALDYGPKTMEVSVNHQYEKNAGLTHFLKGYYDGKTVTALTGQESYKLNTYAVSNCLIEIGEETTCIASGEKVKIHLINH